MIRLRRSKGSLGFGLIFVAICLIVLGVTTIKERYFEKSVLVINNKTIKSINNVKIIYVEENKVIDAGDIKRESKYKHKIDTNKTGAILLEYTEHKKKTHKYQIIPEITPKMERVEVILDDFMYPEKIEIKIGNK